MYCSLIYWLQRNSSKEINKSRQRKRLYTAHWMAHWATMFECVSNIWQWKRIAATQPNTMPPKHSARACIRSWLAVLTRYSLFEFRMENIRCFGIVCAFANNIIIFFRYFFLLLLLFLRTILLLLLLPGTDWLWLSHVLSSMPSCSLCFAPVETSWMWNVVWRKKRFISLNLWSMDSCSCPLWKRF